jgi:hypothetical protein
MGDQPNQVVAFGATRGRAALARHEWLTANRWLPPLNETKNEEGKASARRTSQHQPQKRREYGPRDPRFE